MSWDYRAVKRNYGNENEFSISEVYYDDEGAINGITKEPVSPTGETMEVLREAIKDYVGALDKPVLNWENF